VLLARRYSVTNGDSRMREPGAIDLPRSICAHRVRSGLARHGGGTAASDVPWHGHAFGAVASPSRTGLARAWPAV